MQQHTKNKIRLLSAAVLLASSLPGFVGQAYARVNAPAVISMLSPKPVETVSSDILSAEGVTVYLSDWNITPETEEGEQTQQTRSSPSAPRTDETEPPEITEASEPEESEPEETDSTDPTGSEPEETQPEEGDTKPTEPSGPTEPPNLAPEIKPSRQITFSVSEEDSKPGDFQLTTDTLLHGEVAVSAGTVTLTLTPADRAYSMAARTVSTVTVTWKGLTASIQVPLTLTEDSETFQGVEAVTDKTEDKLAFLVYGDQNGYRMKVSDSEGNPVPGLRYSVDNGETWQQLYDAAECPLAIPGSGLVLLDLTKTDKKGLNIQVAGAESLSEIATLPDAGMSADPFLLERTGDLTPVTVNTGWLGCNVGYELQKLVRKYGGAVWQTADSDVLPEVTISQDKLTVSLPQTGQQVPAGSYRLVIQWYSGSQIVYKSAAEFFISYPTRS